MGCVVVDNHFILWADESCLSVDCVIIASGDGLSPGPMFPFLQVDP